MRQPPTSANFLVKGSRFAARRCITQGMASIISKKVNGQRYDVS